MFKTGIGIENEEKVEGKDLQNVFLKKIIDDVIVDDIDKDVLILFNDVNEN